MKRSILFAALAATTFLAACAQPQQPTRQAQSYGPPRVGGSSFGSFSATGGNSFSATGGFRPTSGLTPQGAGSLGDRSAESLPTTWNGFRGN